MNQKGFVNIIFIVVIVILVGVVGYFVFFKKSEPIAQQPTPTPTRTITPTETPVSPTPTPVTSTTQNYKGTEFSVSYPKSWIIQNHDCSDIGGLTVLI